MSCGNPHETPCTEVLDRVYSYLDGELDAPDIAKIRQHLDECGPCLAEYGLDRLVRQLVHKHCGHDLVPHALREKVLIRIQQVKAEMIVSQGERPPGTPPMAQGPPPSSWALAVLARGSDPPEPPDGPRPPSFVTGLGRVSP